MRWTTRRASVGLLILLPALPVQAQRSGSDHAIKVAIRRELAHDSLVTGLPEVRDSATLHRKYLLCTGTGDSKRCRIRDGKPFFTIEEIEVSAGDSGYAIVARWEQVEGSDPRIARFSQVWHVRKIKGRWIAAMTDEVRTAN